MRTVLLASACTLLSALAAAQTPTPAPGVPQDVAIRRAATIFDLRYDLTLTVPKALAEPITGTNRITFDLRENTLPLVIDFETSREHIDTVTANGTPAPFTYINGHIVVPNTALRTGRNTVEIRFRAGDASLNRSADFLYALFVPARAGWRFRCSINRT
jgi:aminopeptidase N